MAVTSRGTKWERKESCYIIVAFIPLLNWIAFLYVGLTANVKRWIYWSIFYAIPLILVIYILNFGDFLGSPSTFDKYYNIIQIMAIIHAFWIRKEYLVRLEALQGKKILTKDEVKSIIEKNKSMNLPKEVSEVKDTSEKLKETIIKEANINKKQANNTLAKDTKVSEIINDTQNREEPTIGPIINTNEKADNMLAKDIEKTLNSIDINTASESELASLPGIGLILAKKAIKHRETKGYFNSIDEFAEILSLKPHVLERIKSLIVVNKIESNHKTDEFSSKSGRIVDF